MNEGKGDLATQLTLEEALQIRLMLTACKNSYSESTAEAIAKVGVKAVPVLIEWLVDKASDGKKGMFRAGKEARAFA